MLAKTREQKADKEISQALKGINVISSQVIMFPKSKVYWENCT